MSVGSVSFWQQDQKYWQGSSWAQATQESDSLISIMGNAITTESNGLASLANQSALNRVNTALSAAVQSALNSATSSDSSTASSATTTASSSASSSGSSTSSNTLGAPAIGTGTVPLTTSTSLFTLGVLAQGVITISDNTNTTTYRSTGKDTVGDLINAINAVGTGKANVTAGLNGSGQLVFTGKDDTDTIIVGGAYAGNIGFGPKNDTFEPTAPASPAGSSSSSSSSTSSSSASPSTASSSSGTSSTSSNSSTSASSGIQNNSAFALQTTGTAEILLASNGSSGSILNLLV